MGREARVSIILTAKNLASGALKEVEAGVNKVKAAFASLKMPSSFSGIGSAVDGLKSGLTSLQGAVGAVGGAISGLATSAVVGLAGLAASSIVAIKYLTSVNSEYGKLLTQLETFTGSAAGAKAVFKDLSHFAAVTPFQIDEVVQAYITLRTAGINPTMETMQLLGDQASAMGHRIQDFALAIRSATSGEFEPMKTFGVQMHVMGNEVIATFQGVTTTIGRDTKSIVNYLEGLSKSHFAGGMERESKTLGGALSNAQDAAESLARALGDSGFTSIVTDATLKLTDWTNALTTNEGPMKRFFDYIKGSFAVAGQSFNVFGKWLDVVSAKWKHFQIVLSGDGSPIDPTTGLPTGGPNPLRDNASKAIDDAQKALDAALAGRQSAIDRRTMTQGPTRKEYLLGKSDDDLTNRERSELQKLLGSDSGGLKATGLADANGTPFDPGAAKRVAAEAKKAHEEWVSNMTERAALAKELLDLGVNLTTQFQQSLELETLLAAAAKRMKDPGDEAKLLRAARDLKKQRIDAGGITPEEQAGVNAGVSIGAGIDADSAALKREIELKADRDQFELGKTLSRQFAANTIGGTTRADGTVDGGTFVLPGANHALAALSLGLKGAIGQSQQLADVIGGSVTSVIDGFGDAIGAAFEQMGEGSHAAGDAFKSAMLGALGSVASQYGRYFLAKSIGELAEGVGDLSNPITAALAPGHFAASAEFGFAGSAMMALAGSLGGGALRASGANGRAGAAANNAALPTSDKGDAVLVVEGGLLNMDDPAQADALANALSVLSDRRVTIKKR